MPKRFQNELYLGYLLGTLKNTIFDAKTWPRGTPKIADFLQKSPQKPVFGFFGKNAKNHLEIP